MVEKMISMVDAKMVNKSIKKMCDGCGNDLEGRCGSCYVLEAMSIVDQQPIIEIPSVDEIFMYAIDSLEKEYDYCGGPSGIAWMRGYRSGIAAAIRILQEKEWTQDGTD